MATFHTISSGIQGDKFLASAAQEESSLFLQQPPVPCVEMMNIAEDDLRKGLRRFQSRTSLDTLPSEDFLE